MIEVLILIAVALIGILLVLGRISLTLKGILEVVAEARGAVSFGSLSSADGASSRPAGAQSGLTPQSGHHAEPSPDENRGATDALQDIAAVVAVAERAMRRRSTHPYAS
ncbi:MAG: hypothetical protein ACYC1H_00610 [Rectinema subterraneum]